MFSVLSVQHTVYVYYINIHRVFNINCTGYCLLQLHDGCRLLIQDLVWILRPAMSSSLSSTMHVAKDMDKVEGSPFFPSLFSPASLEVDRGTVCIPSPYADNAHGETSYYGPSVPEKPAMAPPLSPSLFWTSHNSHAMPALSLHCPPSLPYSEPQIHAPWVNAKEHSAARNRLRGGGVQEALSHNG